MASLMVGSAVEKGLKSSTAVVTTCVNSTVMVTSNLTNDSLPTISQTCSSNEEAIMLEYAMAVSLMAGFIMVIILSW